MAVTAQLDCLLPLFQFTTKYLSQLLALPISGAADVLMPAPAGDMWFRGTVDFAVVPFNVSEKDAGKHIRVGILFKVRMQHQQVLSQQRAVEPASLL